MNLGTLSLALALAGLAAPVLSPGPAAYPSRVSIDQDCPLQPDEKFDDLTPTLPASSMTHSREEILTFIRDHISADLADEIGAVTHPQTGCVRLCERTGYGTGITDATTIALRTSRMPLWLCAIVLIHEYRHWQRAIVVGVNDGDPGAGDPETAAENPCGWCNHAAMGGEDAALAGELCYQLSRSERKQLCALAWEWRATLAKTLTQCMYEGCTACCGFSYLPNLDEIWSAPPCCQ